MAFAWLAVAAIGIPLGLTMDRRKVSEGTGFSLGIIYPNTWGQITFLFLIIFWYLFLQKKRLVTFCLFIATALFMFFVPKCKTIAVLAVFFPFLTLLMKPREFEELGEERCKKQWGAGRILLIAFPFLCFALTMILCWQMEWVKKYAYDTPLLSMAMRFVQGGIAFQHYGFPLIGHTLPNDPSVIAVVNGEAEMLYVVDNAFVTYGLFLGAIWMLWALCWLSYANWRGLKNRDNGLVLIGGIMMAFAIMERPGLAASYNFLFLYPLASVAYLKEPEEKLTLQSFFGIEKKTSETKIKPVQKKKQPTRKRHT